MRKDIFNKLILSLSVLLPIGILTYELNLIFDITTLFSNTTTSNLLLISKRLKLIVLLFVFISFIFSYLSIKINKVIGGISIVLTLISLVAIFLIPFLVVMFQT